MSNEFLPVCVPIHRVATLEHSTGVVEESFAFRGVRRAAELPGSMGQSRSRPGVARGFCLAALLAAIAPCTVYSQTQKQRTDMAAHIIGLNMNFLEVRFQ